MDLISINLLGLSLNDAVEFWGSADMQPEVLIAIAISFIVGIIALQIFLFAMFYREQVKKDLSAKVCQPIHIRWQPFQFWARPYHYDSTKFKVTFSDPFGSVHEASCVVYRPLLENPISGSFRVDWLTDTVIRQEAPEV
jgi:hypothetical protein